MTETPNTPTPNTPTPDALPPTPTRPQTDEEKGREWLDRMIAEHDEHAEKFTPGDVYEPHDGETSDLNLHYADLFAEPNPAHDPTRQGQ